MTVPLAQNPDSLVKQPGADALFAQRADHAFCYGLFNRMFWKNRCLRPSFETHTGEARVLLSDCIVCQANCHGLLSLIIALMMTRSLRATAMRATIFGFPAARSRR